MNFLRISYVPHAHIRFTDEEIRVLFLCAEHHYDYTCQTTVREPDPCYGDERGLLVRIKNWHLNLPGRHNKGFDLKWRDIDLLAKIAEQAQFLPSTDDGKIAFGLLLLFKRALDRLNTAALDDVEIGINEYPNDERSVNLAAVPDNAA
jgi:hypothetical protein